MVCFLQVRQPTFKVYYLDEPWLQRVNVFNISRSYILHSSTLRVPYMSIRDYFTFFLYRNFKVSPSTGWVSAANAACTNIFKKDCILLTHIR
jgi:hypothetical protein